MSPGELQKKLMTNVCKNSRARQTAAGKRREERK